VGEWGWVAAGYAITGLTLMGYLGILLIRARRARLRSDRIAGRRP
jgi:hypothetical protein